MNQNDRLARFAEEINKNAEAQCKKIRSKTERATNQQIAEYEASSKAEFESRVDYEIKRLQMETNREIAAYRFELRQAALAHRQAIMDRVFARAKDRLLAFCEGEAYAALLRDCIEKLCGAIGEQAVIRVCPRDLALAEKLCKDLPGVLRVETDETIEIGLAAACNENETILLSDSFDSRLESQKQEFMAFSGLELEA